MEDNDKDLTQANPVDDLIQSLYGFSDEQLLREFEEAEQDTTSDPNIQVYPDEFDRIWEDICAERASPADKAAQAEIAELPKRKKKLSWKKVAVFALAAALMTASVCFVAVGKKSYFYREKERGGLSSDIVFNNDSSIKAIEDQESAYLKIEDDLGIKPIKLGYLPAGMVFESLEIGKNRAIIQFSYKNSIVYVVQASDKTEISSNYKTDSKAYKKIENKRLGIELKVKKENDSLGFETQFSYRDTYCWIFGVMEENEFMNMAEQLTY